MTADNLAYTPRAATRRRRPALPARSRIDLAALSARLTARDLWLAEMCHEHTVLTSHHIAALAFTSHRSANRRLRTLYFLGLLDAFRPLRHSGSAPEHYTLGRAGAEILAASRGSDVKALDWRKDACARIAFSPTLGHTLGVNTLLTALATARPPGHALPVWLSERSAARLWGDWIRPDAYGHYRDGDSDAPVPFFLEYDTGTEPLARVEAKLPGYAALATTTGTRSALLIHTSTARREASLRARLADTATRLGLPVATACADYLPDAGPAGPVWLPLTTGGRRQLLSRLAHTWPDLTPALTDDALTPTLAPAGRTAFPWQPVPPLPPTGHPG
ncbi:replication-relaxation family protein [Actinacidiphila sp. bgisy167]|uniref:replication-relaxation family protein n=1 Tax=Actinacidiphila sp. bgisy167 TaxID=3413797 RepID=UPI003D732C1E